MAETIAKKLNDSAAARWTALLIVALTMMMGYFITDVMSPLEDLLETSTGQGGMGWNSSEYGFFSGSYGLINVFLLMLFFGGLILDKMGVRFTGVLSCALMIAGVGIKYFAIESVDPSLTVMADLPFDGEGAVMVKQQVLWASLGFAIFGVGCEMCGITVSKVIAKWFTGHELALALGIQVALARLGTAAAIGFSHDMATSAKLSTPILFGMVCLIIGFLAYIVYCVMDSKFDKSIAAASVEGDVAGDDDKFKISDLGKIFGNPGFWLICLLCLLFYSGVFPFLKFATKLMISKYEIDPSFAGKIPALLPFGTILLTPLFGSIYDRIGKGATLMIIGSTMMACVHILFALPILNNAVCAIVIMIVLGVAFSLVPSAMWPSVPKIIPLKFLGSAYAIIFYIQNIGLSLVPMLIGSVLQANTTVAANGEKTMDFTPAMWIFAGFGIVAVLLAVALRVLDAKKHYGLEKANIMQ